MKETEFSKIRVCLFMIWLKAKLAVKMSNFDPSIFALSLADHEFNFALKSRRRTIIYKFLSATWSILISKFYKNFSNSSLFWLVIYKETKTCKFFPQFLIQNLCVHLNIWRWLILKAGNFFSILEFHLVLCLTVVHP